MKLEKTAAFAEIFSSVAIVVTLVILVFEVRGNTNTQQIANRQAIALRGQEMAILLIENPELNEALSKGRSGEDVTEAEQRIISNWVDAHHRLTEEAYNLFSDGQLEEKDWNIRAGMMLRNLSTETSRQIYYTKRDNGWFDLGYTNWMDQALLETYGE